MNMKTKIPTVLSLLCGASLLAQNPALVLPDAPDPQPSVHVQVATPAYPQPHALEDDVKFISNRQTLKSPAFIWPAIGDLASGFFDAEMSKEGQAHHRCVEGGQGLPRYPTRGQLYRHNLEEQIGFGALAFVWTKVKGPRWFLPALAAYPMEVHIRAGLSWYQRCW